MLLSSVTYWIVLGVILGAIVLVFYILSRKKNNKLFQTIGIGIVVLAVVFNKWLFPNVYTVKSCGSVISQVMLMPVTLPDGTAVKYGKHCYVSNESKSPLYIETIFYGNAEASPEKTFNETIAPGVTKQYNTTVINYFFETPASSVRTKSKGVIKYKVACE